MDVRAFVGLRMVMDACVRAGYSVEWAGKASVHEYDVVLVSITAACDWWSFLAERLHWRRGNYKIIVGGAGVLHIVPFVPFVDYFVLGRGEINTPKLLKLLDGKRGEIPGSIVEAKLFSYDKRYHIEQVSAPYDHAVTLEKGNKCFKEKTIGCNHKCYFCGYTWQRRFVSPYATYQMASDGLFGDIQHQELAILDMMKDGNSIDFKKLRTTAIDGFSERLRFMVGKKIKKSVLTDFLILMVKSYAQPHNIKIYNICGYPTETQEDWFEFKECLINANNSQKTTSNGRQWRVQLHCTPFRSMPATPMACAPMSKQNYRGKIAQVLGPDLNGHIFMNERNIFAVQTLGTESLSTVMLDAIVHRGAMSDAENIRRLCLTPKFWRAKATVKEATLEKYFNMDHLFGEFDADTLPSRYLRTYAQVERYWNRKFWENA